MNPVISIIVPVYNVEAYLNRCMESIREQTIKEMEIILVDDGSTDNSGIICDEWAGKDSRITVIHKKNGGLTDAWKTGVRASHGEYIGFVDSDDFIDKNMYEVLLKKASECNADITVCGLVFAFENQNRPERKENSRFLKDVYGREQIIRELFPALINDGSFFGRSLQAARVTKLFKRSIVVNNLQYCNEGVSVGEDLQLTFSAFCDAGKIACLKDFYPYHYWINEASITGRHDPEYADKICSLNRQILFIQKEKGVYDFRKQIYNDLVSLTVLGIKNEICRNQMADRKMILKNIKSFCSHKEVKEALDHYHMPNLKLTERLFIAFLKYRCYALCYYAVISFFG